jgi:hypothetical protein
MYALIGRDKRFMPISFSLSLSLSLSGVVFMAGRVYAVGGFNGSLRVRTVDVYDGVRDQWTTVPSMQERRSTLGSAVLGDLLYAVGGFDGSTGTYSYPPLFLSPLSQDLCVF